MSNSLLQNAMSFDNFDYDHPMHRSELREGAEKIEDENMNDDGGIDCEEELGEWIGGGKRIELG